MGPPLAIRLANDHIRWIDDQAATYHLSGAALVRLMIEDHANWFSIPPTMAALLAREQEQMKLSYRSYMQFVLIERDKQLAVSLDLYNTPTFFFNGRKVVGDRPYEYLKKIAEEEIAAAN